MATRWMLGVTAALIALGAAACGSGSAHETAGSSAGGHGGQEASPTASSSSAAGGADAGPDGAGAHDGGDAGFDAAGEDATEDGMATRVACTSSYGSIVSAAFGRLDGYLVAIVPEGTHECNGDSSHVHLQVKAKNAVYDVAVNEDVLYAEKDAPLPDGAWAEGWHTGIAFDYVKNLGLHKSAFTTGTAAEVRQKVEAELANANHISIFATGYGPSGVHDVHFYGSGEDGAIVIDPLGPVPHILTFCFSTDSF